MPPGTFQVALSWAGASVLIQYIYRNLSFNSPFLLTYICTSLFAVYLPWVTGCGRLGLLQNPRFAEAQEVPYVTVADFSPAALDRRPMVAGTEDRAGTNGEAAEEPPQVSPRSCIAALSFLTHSAHEVGHVAGRVPQAGSEPALAVKGPYPHR